jgi:uncharacterized membrane-anchored protein
VLQPDPTGESPVTTACRSLATALSKARFASGTRTKTYTTTRGTTRTRLQLRLQTTVEGHSVAAITYYVVGLFGYLVKAAHDSGRMMTEPSIVTAAFVPIAALAIWWTVRRIRKKNIAGED